MVDLVPAPSDLHLASPALGPWFRHDSDTPPTLPLPDGDLAIPITLTPNMEWRAPAGALRRYLFASNPRPPALAPLRAENGTPAFVDDTLVVLLTLLPEVEARLAALASPLPSPDGVTLPAGVTVRPRVRHFALEVPAANASTMADIEQLRPANFDTSPPGFDPALFLGLTQGTPPTNGTQPVTELCRPETSSAIALQNRTGTPLAVRLWCFDHRGRALDAGAVANWWAKMATTGVWDNLWASSTAADQRTATVSAGRLVALVNAHEGPLDAAVMARLNLTDLTKITGSSALYSIGAMPAIALTAAASADSDILPIPRLALLPNGTYTNLATATPFEGWRVGWPADFTRDFARVALTDIESHLVGRTRAHVDQANPRLRVTAARNTAANPVLTNTEAVTTRAMATLSAGNASLMSPVLDSDWGATAPPATFGTGPLPNALTFTPRALAGEGTASGGGGSVAGQTIALHFLAGALPAGCWIRVWTHGIDTATGRRVRQTGGSAIADVNGEAFVILPLPDGQATANLSADALVVIDGGSRYFADLRFARPALVAGARVSRAAPGSATFINTSRGQPFVIGGSGWRSGDRVLADTAGTLALLDPTTLIAADMVADTLPVAVGAGDTLIITQPAFGQTPEGSLTTGPNGATLVRRTRNALTRVTGWGQPVPSQERRELAARDATGTAIIGGTPGLSNLHEAPPSQLGHPGIPAGNEVHGTGLAIAGPAADRLNTLMIERQATSILDYVPLAGRPFVPTADPGTPGTWTAVLETTTHGMHGDGAIRALLDHNGGSFTPGADWVSLKNDIEAASGQDLDPVIDTANFDDDLAAAALDRLIVKARDGAQEFATAALAAIARAEDLIYLETPSLDAQAGPTALVTALTARLAVRPGLVVILMVPQRFLPSQTAKLEDIRKAGIGAALAALQAAAPDRVVLLSPNAGPGRSLHLGTTTLIVDDAILITGSAHGWRRGMSFDSALSAALFDESIAEGRPATVRAARLALLGQALGLPAANTPEDPIDAVRALRRLNQLGGKSRVSPGAYPAVADPTSQADHDIWNPDGRPGVVPDWFIFLAALTGSAATDFNNAIR
jgi:hypothetical protein